MADGENSDPRDAEIRRLRTNYDALALRVEQNERRRNEPPTARIVRDPKLPPSLSIMPGTPRAETEYKYRMNIKHVVGHTICV